MTMSSQDTNTESVGTANYDEIFTRYRRPLIRYAVRMLGDQMEAEDVVMDVFTTCLRRQTAFSNVFAAWTFLAVSTKNACLNRRRQAKRKMQQEALFYYSRECEENVLEYLDMKDLKNQAWCIVAGLPPECRRVFILCYLGGMREDAVAEQCNVSHHTIRNQKVRGLKLVRERFQMYSALLFLGAIGTGAERMKS